MTSGKLEGGDYRCPHCKEKLDGYASIGHDAVPQPGSLTVCGYCGCIGEYTDNSIKIFTAAQLDQLDPETRAMLVKTRNITREHAKKSFPPGYYRDAEAMRAAAVRWVQEHPCAQVTFNRIEDRLLYIGSLNEKGISLLACNEHAAALLRYMDKASGGRGTILQARSVLEVVFGAAGSAPSA